jgi:hypothetical protein
MKLLLDECLPVDFRHHLPGHDPITIVFQGWAGIKNGKLLALAASAGFEAMVTTDGSIEFQKNLAALPLAIVILESPSNDLPDLLPLVPALLDTLKNLTPRAITHVHRP